MRILAALCTSLTWVAVLAVSCKPQSADKRRVSPQQATQQQAAQAVDECTNNLALTASEVSTCKAALDERARLEADAAAKVAASEGKYNLVAKKAKPYDIAFPGSSERFFISSDNSIFYDFKREDGKWDIEEKARQVEAGEAEVPDYTSDEDFDTPNQLNVLFPSKWGIKQAQPIRMSNGLVAMFFIDKDKKLKVISQLSQRSGIWQTYNKAIEIDENIEAVFPILNAQNKIDVVYLKNKNNQQVMFFRPLEDENNLAAGFGLVNYYPKFTGMKDTGELLKLVGESMKKTGVILVSAKAGDLANYQAVEYGKTPEGAATSLQEEKAQELALTEIAGGYKDGRAKAAATREGSFGKSITTKEGWDSPSKVCANIATVGALGPIVASGPVSGLLSLGMYAGLQRPEDLKRAEEATAAAGIDAADWFAARANDASNTLAQVELAVDASGRKIEWVDLRDEDVTIINNFCIALNEGIENGSIASDQDGQDAVEFCQDFSLLATAKSEGRVDQLLGEQETQAEKKVASTITFKMGKQAYNSFSALAGNADGANTAAMRSNALSALKIAGAGLGVFFLGPLAIPPLLVYGTFRAVKFAYTSAGSQFTLKGKLFAPGAGSTASLKAANATASTTIAKLEANLDEAGVFQEVQTLAQKPSPTQDDIDAVKTKIRSSSAPNANKLADDVDDYLTQSKAVKRNEYIVADRELAEVQAKANVQKAKIDSIEKQLKKQNISVKSTSDNGFSSLNKNQQELVKRYESHTKKFQDENAKVETTKSKINEIKNSNVLSEDDLATSQSRIRNKLTEYKVRLKSWVKSLPARAWRGIKKLPGKIATRIVSSYKNMPKEFAKNWASAEGLKQQAGMLGVAVVAGTVATYGAQQDNASIADKWKGAGEGGVNAIVESPITALEGINGIHSTAGALCRGEFGTAFKNAANMGANLVKGAPQLLTSVLKIACDGIKALRTNTRAEGVGAVALDWTVCAAKDAVSWVSEQLGTAVNAINETVAPAIGSVLNDISKGIGSLWTGDTSTNTVQRVSASQVTSGQLQLVSPNLVFCIDDPCPATDPGYKPRCFKENPVVTPLEKLTPVEFACTK